ncbi:MAG: translation initiation factor IF-2 [Candidatus Diapherotrites archaeon]|nr:translation initiation factor IF-2 [Candidatus Diapherotrites archaeon]
MIRQPIVTVLGHVDHGKTKFLDKIRGTTVAEKIIKHIAGDLMLKFGFQVDLPGLLFIDTPGHAAFTSLRERGGSIADLAVLIVDLTQGFQEQTIEALNILKEFKTPFIVGANKIDLVFEWQSNPGGFSKNLQLQSERGKKALDEKIYLLVGKLHELGFQSERFDRCSDFTKQVPIVPISAKTGEGLPEILMLLAGLSQRFLRKQLSIEENEPGKGTILEVREEKGLGKTVDVILYSGVLNVNDKIVLGGKNGVIETKVRALLMPKPLHEIRTNGLDKFLNVKSVHAAVGVKIAAPNLGEALAGSPLLVEKSGKEAEIVAKEIAAVKVETDAVGPILKADTLGALEAMMVLMRKERELKPKRADVGDVTRKDVVEAVAVREHEPLKGIIFAFNVKIEESAQAEAEKNCVRLFQGNVIYKLIEDYDAWVKQQMELRNKDRLSKLVLPAKLRFMQGFIFRHSKPAIVGIKVLDGKLRPGVRLFNEKGGIVGKVGAMQVQGKGIEEACRGQEVAVSIEGGVVGRNMQENDVLYTFIPEKQFCSLLEMGSCICGEETGLIAEIKRLQEKVKEEESG